MEAVLLVIHLIVAVSIIVLVLLQPAEAGDFMGGGGGNMGAPRRAVDVLSRATTILGACFFVTSLLLAVISGHRPAPKSILDALPAAAVEKPAAVQEKAAEPAKPTAPISK